MSQSKGLASLQIFVSLGLMGVGIQAVIKGWQRTLKLIVDRGVQDIPSNLPKQDPESNYSSAAQLINMLEGRKNLAFISPKGLIPQTIERFFPRLIYIPFPLRHTLHKIGASFFYTAIAIILFFLSTIVESILTQNSNVSNWLGLILIFGLLLVWFKNRPNESNFYIGYVSDNEIRYTIIILGIGFVVPVLFNISGINLPPPPVNPFLWFIILLVLGGTVLSSAFYLTKIRAEYSNANTNVSEDTGKNWQYSIHPTDLFRFFNNAMMQKRFLDRPNRTYYEFSPQIEGNKGEFNGDIVIETQPALNDTSNTLPSNFSQIQWLSAVIGQGLCVLSAITILYLVSGYTASIVSISVLAFIFWFYGTSLIAISHKFWSETLFKSYLVHFSVEGTFVDSNNQTGKGFQESVTKSVMSVQSNLTPTFRTSKITSVVFASPKPPFLMSKRYILEMDNADEYQNELVDAIKNTVSEHKEILAFNNATKTDIKEINSLNIENNLKNNFFQLNNPLQNQLDEFKLNSLGIENKRWVVKNLPFDVSYLFLKDANNPPFNLELVQNGTIQKGQWNFKSTNLIEIKIGEKISLYEITDITENSCKLLLPNTTTFMELEIE